MATGSAEAGTVLDQILHGDGAGQYAVGERWAQVQSGLAWRHVRAILPSSLQTLTCGHRINRSLPSSQDIDLWLRDGYRHNQSCSVMVPCILRSVNVGLRFSQSLHDVTKPKLGGGHAQEQLADMTSGYTFYQCWHDLSLATRV